MGCRKDSDSHLAGPLSLMLKKASHHVVSCHVERPMSQEMEGSLQPTPIEEAGRELNLADSHLSELESQSLHVQP